MFRVKAFRTTTNSSTNRLYLEMLNTADERYYSMFSCAFDCATDSENVSLGQYDEI